MSEYLQTPWHWKMKRVTADGRNMRCSFVDDVALGYAVKLLFMAAHDTTRIIMNGASCTVLLAGADRCSLMATGARKTTQSSYVFGKCFFQWLEAVNNQFKLFIHLLELFLFPSILFQ